MKEFLDFCCIHGEGFGSLTSEHATAYLAEKYGEDHNIKGTAINNANDDLAQFLFPARGHSLDLETLAEGA
ncbi:hypothetical protein [Ensifer aridi]|uniref:hypothetical protein n=1 Tax=Ensifer aridi TaxID=1708715 RepID=UPI00358FB4AB